MFTGDAGAARTTVRWREIRDLALRAEEMGFDSVWSPDELLWRSAGGPQRGFWEGIAMAGAICAVTSRVEVGTWVMSALHRNPGITAKAVETLDEISGDGSSLGWVPVTRGRARRAPSAFPRRTFTSASRRHWRSSSRCCAAAMRTSRGRTTQHMTWTSCRSVRGRVASQS